MRRLRNILVAMVALATVALLPVDASSHSRQIRAPARARIVVTPARTKVVIVKRQKRVWVPGHWRWNERAHRYVWVKGHYMDQVIH
jgi:hypothetical protein